jgi:tetratricopeptide (TPR) repeat protein
MGLFDKIFVRKSASLSSSEELRDSLVESALSANEKRLDELLASHRRQIEGQCLGWTHAPEAIRNDKAAITRYADGILAVAAALAKRGQPALLNELKAGGPEGNPLIRWEGAMKRARSLMGEGDYGQALQLLEDQLIDSRQLVGTGPERYRAITLGMISQCRFHGGDVEAASAPAQAALEACEKAGDLQGIHAYLETAMQIRRYLGQADEAADLAERLAEVSDRMGRRAESQLLIRRASVIRAGEPLCRILIVIDGHRYEVDDAPRAVNNRIAFEFERNRLSLGRSNALVRKGEQAGSDGRPADALLLFQQAAPLDPYNPEPHYQAAVALMDLGRASDAVEELRVTEELAPGWFQCRSDLWLAEQVALGNLRTEVFTALRALSDGPGTPEQKGSLAGSAVAKGVALAPLHLLHGAALAASGRPVEAEAACRRGLSVAREPDVRTRLLVQLAQVLPAGDERTLLLKDARALRGNLVASATASYLLRCGA